MPTMTGARFLAETLKAYGVSTIFYMPAIVRRALMEMEDVGIRRINTHGEKAAAYMADGYARTSRRPGICFAQSVGALNLAAGLQDAYLGLSPVIAITGHRPLMHQYRNSYQEVDHMPAFEPVTKYNVVVDSIQQMPHILRQAFREATSGAPGPVHLDFQGIAGDTIVDAEASLEVLVEDAFAQVPAFRPEPDPEKVREAARVLSQAQRPVIVAGGGVTSSGAQREVVELAEMLSIPVATALNAKGTIPEDHPLAAGVPGSYSRWCANRIINEADLVLFIGSHTGSQVTLDWKIPAMGTQVIQIDIDPSEIGRSYPAKVGLHGDARSTVRRLIEVLEPLGPRSEWTDRVKELVGEWRAEASPMLNSEEAPVRPERICQAITDTLPPDGLLVSDTGHSGIWTGTMVELKSPDQGYIRCAGSLGWGFPAALGAKCAAPDRPVVCFTGDGGFWYHMSELETAARYGINAVTVVNNNRGLTQDKRGDEVAYEGREGNSGELWRYTDVDFAHIARTIGCFGIRVEKPSELSGAIEQALASNQPAVVDVVADIDGISPPPWGG